MLASGPGTRRNATLLAAAAAAGVPVGVVDERVLGELADTVTPQGLIAVCRRVDVTLGDAFTGAPRLAVVLDAVRDPGNAGTVLRTAAAAGADAAVFAAGTVEAYNPKCVRASAGSLFHLPLVAGEPRAAAVATARAAGMTVYAADADGPDNLDALADRGGLGVPTAWLFGNEARGLSAAARQGADRVVRVPMYGRAESLNLAAAAAVCLYASARALHAGC